MTAVKFEHHVGEAPRAVIEFSFVEVDMAAWLAAVEQEPGERANRASGDLLGGPMFGQWMKF